MSNAFYVQNNGVDVRQSQQNVTLQKMRLGPGNWVIFVKFDVAVLAGADTDLMPRISSFGLEFAGHKDTSFCHLNQGGLDTVVLNVAGTHTFSAATTGNSPLFLNARLFCIQTNSNLEVRRIAMTAISVDELN